MKCSECEYAKFLSSCQAYTCEHPECKDAIIFKGKTKPHACPLCGGKKYVIHKNSSRGTASLVRDVVAYKYTHGL